MLKLYRYSETNVCLCLQTYTHIPFVAYSSTLYSTLRQRNLLSSACVLTVQLCRCFGALSVECGR